ncbi:hypothetical protein BKA65DRAFT_507844 [Rhexocercosporidium sp. MPI-PUGE-AT-0058]|nr:hypothetical protein BKA65DRAFT_507844 [Rhexocercosporidium sp. MPI-PUGE-AT-0058]
MRLCSGLLALHSLTYSPTPACCRNYSLTHFYTLVLSCPVLYAVLIELVLRISCRHRHRDSPDTYIHPVPTCDQSTRPDPTQLNSTQLDPAHPIPKPSQPYFVTFTLPYLTLPSLPYSPLPLPPRPPRPRPPSPLPQLHSLSHLSKLLSLRHFCLFTFNHQPLPTYLPPYLQRPKPSQTTPKPKICIIVSSDRPSFLTPHSSLTLDRTHSLTHPPTRHQIRSPA